MNNSGRNAKSVKYSACPSQRNLWPWSKSVAAGKLQTSCGLRCGSNISEGIEGMRGIGGNA